MTYCALSRPRMYKLPGVDVPWAVNVTMCLEPNRIGSRPGAGPDGSTGCRPGSTPKSTPGNSSESRCSPLDFPVHPTLNVAAADAVPIAIDVDCVANRLPYGCESHRGVGRANDSFQPRLVETGRHIPDCAQRSPVVQADEELANRNSAHRRDQARDDHQFGECVGALQTHRILTSAMAGPRR